MVKFFAAAFAALAAVASAADKTPCVPLSYVENAADLAALNTVIDIVLQGNLLKPNLVALDPLSIADKRVDSIPLSVLGVDLAITPVIKTLNVSGISNVVPRHLNVTGPTGLDIGADFNGELSLAGTVSLEIVQLEHKWWQICWTDILHPKNCPPAVIDVDIGVGLNLPSVFTNANVSMVKCSPTAPAGTCTDLTVTDILLAGLSGQINDLLARILRRLNNVSLNSLAIDFDKITALNFHFHTSGSLITEIGKKLLNFSVTEINKKGDFYKVLIEIVNKLAKTLLNLVLKEKLSPMLGNTCYDA